MDKNEQKIYEHITKDATSKMDFNQISNKVDYSQYKKVWKVIICKNLKYCLNK